jgi:hypothetical protein
MGLLVLAF